MKLTKNQVYDVSQRGLESGRPDAAVPPVELALLCTWNTQPQPSLTRIDRALWQKRPHHPAREKRCRQYWLLHSRLVAAVASVLELPPPLWELEHYSGTNDKIHL